MCVINVSVNAKDRQAEKPKLREALTAEIIADLEHEIGDVLTWAPEGVTDEDRKAIRDEVIAQTRLVTDALTTEELSSVPPRSPRGAWLKTSEAVGKAAPKLAESALGVGKSADGIAADVHTATSDFVKPKTSWQRMKAWLETAGKVGARFL